MVFDGRPCPCTGHWITPGQSQGPPRLEHRHQDTREKARWLDPNPNLPAGAPATVAVAFAALRDELLNLVHDGPQLTIGLQRLVDAKDAAVRQAIADSDRLA